MNFKYKLQILIYPFIIFPAIIIILINFFINTSKTKDMEYKILENYLNNILLICETENDIISRLKMNEDQYYSAAVKKKVLTEISQDVYQNEKTFIIKSKTKKLVYFSGVNNDIKEKSLFNNKYLDDMISIKNGRMEFIEHIDNKKRKKCIAVYKYYPEWDWLIVASLSKDNLYKYVYSATYLSLLITTIFLIILIIILYMISRGISKPLEQLEEGTIKIAKNDYDINIDIKSNDEFGNIAKKFNNMAAKIKEYSVSNKQIIKKLQESENRFRRLTENAKDLIYRMSLKDGRYEYVSKAVENITGYKAEEFYNNQYFIRKIIHPDWINYFENEWGNLIKGSMSPSYEYKIIDKSGKEKWLYQRNVLVKDENENPIAIEGIVTDITERKQVEEEVKYERTLLKRITETSPIGIIMVNCDGLITFANYQAEKLLGLTKDEILQRAYNAPEWRITDFNGGTFPDENLPFRQVITGHKPVYDIRHAIEWPDGRRVYLSINGAPLLDEAGKIESIVFALEDITSRKQSEQSLRKSEERYRMAETIGHVGNWEYKLQPMEFWGSDEAKRIYGFDPEQENFTTDEVENCILEKERVHQALIDLIEKGTPYDLEFEIHPINSSKPKVILSKAELLKDENGIPYKVVGVIQDITKRKQAEEQLYKLNRIYSVLSNINQTIIRIHETKTLFNEVCRISGEYGEFSMSWIGIANPKTNKIDVVASNGGYGDYLDKIKIDLNDELHSSGPAGKSFKTGSYFISNNIQNDPSMIPWRDDAVKFDFKSLASFPLIVFDKVIGVFLVYTNKTDFFEEEDIFLLDEVAKDISFAVEFIELEIQRKKSEEKAIQLASIVESSDDAIIGKTLDGIITSWNKGAETIYGYTENEMIGKTILVLVPDEHKDEVTMILKKIKNGEHIKNYETVRKRKNGQLINVFLTVSPLYSAEGKIIGASVIGRDITTRKKDEQKIKTALQEKEVLLKELYHRTKNNMMVICAMMHLHSEWHKSDKNIYNVFMEMENRIHSMALVHEKLYRSKNLSSINMKEYIQDEIHHLIGSYNIDDKKISFNLEEIDDIFLLLDSAVPCGLIINELITNSIKYAFPGRKKGMVTIKFKKEKDDYLNLQVSDNGVGVKKDFDFNVNNKMGLMLINNVVKNQLMGQVSFINDNGITCKIRFKDTYYQKRI